MDYKILNLKEFSPTTQQALAIFQINLTSYKMEGVKIVKVIHGYGSHGVGGGIRVELRKLLQIMKRNKEIKDYLYGSEWDKSFPKCFKILTEVQDCFADEDLGKGNPGITIVVL